MKYITIVLAAMLSIGEINAQVHPFFGGSLGYLNNVALSMKAGLQAGRFNAEAGIAFSQVVPFQNSLKIGYSFGSNWYAIPYAGAAYYTYANHDKEKNYLNPAVGLEFGKHIDLTGTSSKYLLEAFDIYAEYFGKWIGVGFKIVL